MLPVIIAHATACNLSERQMRTNQISSQVERGGRCFSKDSFPRGNSRHWIFGWLERTVGKLTGTLFTDTNLPASSARIAIRTCGVHWSSDGTNQFISCISNSKQELTEGDVAPTKTTANREDSSSLASNP